MDARSRVVMRAVAGVVIFIALAQFPASVASGSSHDHRQVRDAQRTLALLGLDPGPADGTLGPRTRAALARFQKAEGLRTSGALDAATRARLVEHQREHVRKVQSALKDSGYDPGAVDGVMGSHTKAALRRYAEAPAPSAPSERSQLIEQFRRLYGSEIQQSP
jgi:peptidoglycan hydrolase-like protein with peptidoglycan-binding domain